MEGTIFVFWNWTIALYLFIAGVSAGAFAATPEMNPDAQLRTLLGLKLAEHYADFAALEKEDRDLVVPAHYRTVLAEVFAVLQAEGIPLTPAPEG